MANEFWNVVVGIISGIIVGMVLHSAMGHSYGRRLWEIFHKGERPNCYGNYISLYINCPLCPYRKECVKEI